MNKNTKDEALRVERALKLALEALESCSSGDYSTGHVIHPSFDVDAVNRAINAVDEALAKSRSDVEQPAQQEPVARQYQGRDGVWRDFINEKHYKDTLEDGSWPIRALYTSPQPSKPWVGLTDEQIAEIAAQGHQRWIEFARAIEAAHGIYAPSELKENE